jgi:hypothetical protein
VGVIPLHASTEYRAVSGNTRALLIILSFGVTHTVELGLWDGIRERNKREIGEK